MAEKYGWSDEERDRLQAVKERWKESDPINSFGGNVLSALDAFGSIGQVLSLFEGQERPSDLAYIEECVWRLSTSTEFFLGDRDDFVFLYRARREKVTENRDFLWRYGLTPAVLSPQGSFYYGCEYDFLYPLVDSRFRFDPIEEIEKPLERLSADIVRRIEGLRRQVVELKLHLLNLCCQAVEAWEPDSLMLRCIERISDVQNGGLWDADADFLWNLEQAFTEARMSTTVEFEDGHTKSISLLCGGVFEQLQDIAWLQTEIKTESQCRLRRCLGDLVRQGVRERAVHGNLELGGRSIGGIYSFWANPLSSSEDAGKLGSALCLMRDLEREQGDYREELYNQIKDKWTSAFHCPIPVKREDLEFKKTVLPFITKEMLGEGLQTAIAIAKAESGTAKPLYPRLEEYMEHLMTYKQAASYVGSKKKVQRLVKKGTLIRKGNAITTRSVKSYLRIPSSAPPGSDRIVKLV